MVINIQKLQFGREYPYDERIKRYFLIFSLAKDIIKNISCNLSLINPKALNELKIKSGKNHYYIEPKANQREIIVKYFPMKNEYINFYNIYSIRGAIEICYNQIILNILIPYYNGFKNENKRKEKEYNKKSNFTIHLVSSFCSSCFY